LSTKHVNTIFCPSCESTFKLSYTERDVSGHSKFCPFCSDELFSNELEEEITEDVLDYD